MNDYGKSNIRLLSIAASLAGAILNYPMTDMPSLAKDLRVSGCILMQDR